MSEEDNWCHYSGMPSPAAYQTDNLTVDGMVGYWIDVLGLKGWTIITTAINKASVIYPDDCPEEDRYFVGIMPQEEALHATIFHDRKLTERDIIHELLHIRYPEWAEEQVNEVEGILYKLNKDE